MHHDLKLEGIKAILLGWIARKPFMRRAWIFGSYALGTQRQDSDIDVAIDIDPVEGDDEPLTSWICNAQAWQDELVPILNKNVQLEWFDPSGETPTIATAIRENGIMIYKRKGKKVKG